MVDISYIYSPASAHFLDDFTDTATEGRDTVAALEDREEKAVFIAQHQSLV